MSLTIKCLGSSVHVLDGEDTLPEGEEAELFTANELSDLQFERREMINMQVPSSVVKKKKKTLLSSSTCTLSQPFLK